MSDFSTKLIQQKNKRGWYSQKRNEFFDANPKKKGEEEKTRSGLSEPTGEGMVSKSGEPFKFENPEPESKINQVRQKYEENLKNRDRDNVDNVGGESKSAESKQVNMADAGEVANVPGADAGANVNLNIQEAKVEDERPRESKDADPLPANPPGPIFGPEDNQPPPPVPNFQPGPDIPIAEVAPAPPYPDAGVAMPVAPEPPMAPPAPPAPPPGPPPGPPAGGPPNPDNPDEPAGPADPQLVEVNRGVPGEGSGQMGFTSSAAARVAGERNRMRYSRDRLINEIRAFVRIYRDQIKTKSFLNLVKIASRLTKNSPAIRLRQVHRQLEEEVIDFYRSASGMRLGVILDPAAIGLNVNQLQSALAPNLAFQGQGEVVRNLARAADAGTPNDPVQRAVDTHYHLGGLAHATRAVLPEGRNLQSNDRPAERIQLLRGRTRKMRVPQEATRRYLWRDTRRPVIPKNIKIKSVRD